MKVSRKLMRVLEKQNAKRPKELTAIPKEQWPFLNDPKRIAVYCSNRFLVQIFKDVVDGANIERLTICRTLPNPDGSMRDNISWDDLYEIKKELGYKDYYAIEVYPRELDYVCVANMRHIWVLLDGPLSIGWFNK